MPQKLNKLKICFYHIAKNAWQCQTHPCTTKEIEPQLFYSRIYVFRTIVWTSIIILVSIVCQLWHLQIYIKIFLVQQTLPHNFVQNQFSPIILLHTKAAAPSSICAKFEENPSTNVEIIWKTVCIYSVFQQTFGMQKSGVFLCTVNNSDEFSDCLVFIYTRSSVSPGLTELLWS